MGLYGTYYDSLRTNIPSDFLVQFGLDSAVLKIEGQSDISLPSCVLDEPADTREIEPSAGQAIQIDTLKIWPTSFSPKPPLGSVIVDSVGIYFTILTVRHKSLVKCWECGCRNLSIVTNPLNAKLNTATILKAKWGKGRANEAKSEWYGYVSGLNPTTIADQVVCRIQPSAEDAMIRFNGEWVKETYRVILQSELPLELAGADYRLVDANGGRYRIMHHAQAQRIDLLPVLIAVRITEGIEFNNQGQPQPLPMP